MTRPSMTFICREILIMFDTAIAYADSANDLRLRIKFDTPGQEDREEETEYKSTFKIREQ